MIKAIVIDDEPLAISVVREYLTSFREIQIVKECSNGDQGLNAILEFRPDLLFLDVQMPRINGFELLEMLEEPLPMVIFSTAYDEYAVKAFEQNAVDYLLKPYSKERFDKAVSKCLALRNTGTPVSKPKGLEASQLNLKNEISRVVVRSGNSYRILPLHDIHYIEAYDDYVKINTADDCFLKKKTMQYFEDTLDPGKFLRVHRSFIIQLDQVTKIESSGKDSHHVVLKSTTAIPLSKNGFGKLKQKLGAGH